MSKKRNGRTRVPAGPLYVIETFPAPAGTEPYAAPWGTSSMPELNHGPDDTIAATEAGKAFIERHEALPPGFEIFVTTGAARRGHEAAVAGRLADPERLREAMEASYFIDQICATLRDSFPGRRLEAAQLRVRRAEVVLAVGREARRDPTTPLAREVLGFNSSPEFLAARFVLEALNMFDRLGLAQGADRAEAAAIFATLSDDALPADFSRAKANFKFRLRVGGPMGPEGVTTMKFIDRW